MTDITIILTDNNPPIKVFFLSLMKNEKGVANRSIYDARL